VFLLALAGYGSQYWLTYRQAQALGGNVRRGEHGTKIVFEPQMEVQDPVKVDPKHYKVEVENEKVRVLRANYRPHEKSVMHSHPESVAIFLNEIHCRFTFPDGKTEERRFRAGETLYAPAGSHLPENLSGHPFDVIIVELKG
jgi:quercetin dioxygenase-like cupin family protein